jgi:Na+/melibiose symporter-like transporter
VFALAAAGALAAVLAAAYLLAAATVERNERAPGTGRWDLGAWRCLLDRRFLVATLGIGIPTKAVLTGVVLFALPLLLRQRGYDLEEVGQIAMLYAAGVLAATSVVARLCHRWGTVRLLAGGAVCSAAAIALLGMIAPAGSGQTVALLGCVALLGMAHGCINAPVVTHVADLPVSRRLGPVRVAATYRLVERIGHVGGPLVVERCLAAAPEGRALAMVGLGVAVAALAFAFVEARRRFRSVR